MDPHSFAPFVRASSARWNRWLRRSIRLYLSLDEPYANIREVEDRLLLVEWQLVRHLVQGEPLTPAITLRARDIVEMAQASFLASTDAVETLRQEMSAAQALNPWQRNYPRQAA